MIVTSSSSGISKGALVGIVLGAIAFVVTFSAIVTILVLRIRLRDYRTHSKRTKGEYLSMNNLAYDFLFSLTSIQCSFSVTIRSLDITARNFILNEPYLNLYLSSFTIVNIFTLSFWDYSRHSE